MIKLILLALVTLICFPGPIFGKAQSKSKVVSKVDDLEVRVESDQPGTVIVENNNGEVKIKTSQGITPTIYISDKKITPTIVTLSPKEQTDVQVKEQLDKKQSEKTKILSWLKNFVTSIFDFVFSR